MKKTTLLLATAVFVVVGAGVVLAQTEDDAAPSGRGPLAGVVEEVLDELVADGTLAKEQADAVQEAFAAKREELRQQFEDYRQQLEEFWEDGQLTEEEIAQLPEASPWSRLTEALEDGVIERDELGRLGRWVPRRLAP